MGKMFVVDDPKMFFGYAKEWWKYRNEPNVLLLHFADLKKDFMGIPLTSSLLETVKMKASFSYMKAHDGKFSPRLWVKTLGKYVLPTTMHVNEGSSGGGASFFTADMNKTWDSVVEEQYGHDQALRHWVENGEPFS